MPASSPALDMRTAHVFSNETGLCDVTIDKVFEGIQSRESKYDEGEFDDYVVATCTVKHVFHQEIVSHAEGRWMREDDSILLWIETDLLTEQSLDDFVALLESVDSMIAFGQRVDVELVKDSSECLSFLEAWKNEDASYVQKKNGGEELLNLPICYFVSDLEDFSLLPIKGGIFDADSVKDIIGYLELDVYSEPPRGGRYFKAGDSVETVYEALERFVEETT